jgi:chromosomal replication initiation ATPase DnaA
MVKTMDTIWQETMNRLQKKMSGPSFETWIKGLTLQSFDEANNRMIIGAENEFTRQWIETRMKDLLEDTLFEVAGERYILAFTVTVKDYLRYSMEQLPPKVDMREENDRASRELMAQVLAEMQSLNQRLDRVENQLSDIKNDIKKIASPTKIPRPVK